MSFATRRDFVMATTAAFAGGALLTGKLRARSSSASSAVAIRKDVSTLTATSPDIVALTKAVDLMKQGKLADGTAMAAADGRNWAMQAAIHGTPDAFTNCQHGNWYFLPWHRIYLYHFEEIVRELSGMADFALPYWDWSRNRTLPATFWGAGNALNCPERAGVQNSGRQPGRTPPMDATTAISDFDFNRYFSPTRISAMLALSDFEEFGGGEVTAPGEEGTTGALEGGPHNRAHTWVGIRPGPDPDRFGDMVLGSSPTDPIFWLHHCNIDRIWSHWAQRAQNSHPASTTWRSTSFNHFYGRDGNSIAAANRITVAKALNSEDLGYRYDSIPAPIVMAAPRNTRVLNMLRATDTRMLDGAQAFALAANDQFATGINEIVQQPTATPDRNTVRLIIKGVKAPKRLDTSYDVYLNCKKLEPTTPITDPSFVGSRAFFHGSGHGHGERGLSFVFNLNQKFAQLYGDRHFKNDEPLEVSIIARVPGVGDAAPTTADIMRINPEQVKIELVGKAQ